MASTAQSLRFSAGAAAASAAAAAAAAAGAGAGSFDALSRILADLCTRGNPKVTTTPKFSSFSLSTFRLDAEKMN